MRLHAYDYVYVYAAARGAAARESARVRGTKRQINVRPAAGQEHI
jgi:hypothetical protein